MSTYVNKKQENKSKAVGNSLPKLQAKNGAPLQFVDNRPAAAAQKEMQKAINNSPKVQQLKTIPAGAGTAVQTVQRKGSQTGWPGRVKPVVQMKGRTNINDDAGLENEADIMGAKALQLRNDEHTKDVLTEPGGMQNDLIQRAVKVGDKQYSFQSIFDENGNPFLKRHNTNKEKGYAKMSPNQPDLNVANINYDDTFLDTTNEDTLEKIKDNIEKYRSVNVKSGDVKGAMVSSKSYLFKGGTRPDVALYDKGGKTPSKYTDFYKDALGDINELITCYKDDDFSVDAVVDIWHNYVHSFVEMSDQKRLVIIAEEYRVPGASKKNEGLDKECYVAVEAYKNKCIEMLNKDMVVESELEDLGNKAMAAYEKCTRDLPWAGTGGKKSFLKDRIADLKEHGITDEEINEQLNLSREDYHPYNIDSPSIHQVFDDEEN